MECEKIKQVIPKYFQHTASEEEIQAVEEHLCVCHDCRTALGELMDKAASSEESAVETGPQQKEKPVEEKPQEKRPEGVPRSEASPKGDEVEGKEDIEYFPGEGLEVPEAEPKQEAEPPQEAESKQEEEEDATFEVITDSPVAPIQELPSESDIAPLDTKESEPVKEEPELPVEPEPQQEEPPVEEEKIEEKAESPVEEPAIEFEPKQEEEKVMFSFGDDKEEVPESLSETGIELKKDEPEEPRLKEEEETLSLAVEEDKEPLDEVSYTLDEAPLEKGRAGFLEYFCLIGGLAVLGFLVYLLLKG